MAVYTFRCRTCGETIFVEHAMTDPHPTHHDGCGGNWAVSSTVRRKLCIKQVALLLWTSGLTSIHFSGGNPAAYPALIAGSACTHRWAALIIRQVFSGFPVQQEFPLLT
jgi:predicted nucleic acid-binding Zn ribbon protein